MKFIYSLLSKYHWNMALWLRKQVRICDCCSSYWSLKARGFNMNADLKKEDCDGSFCLTCGPTTCTCKKK